MRSRALRATEYKKTHVFDAAVLFFVEPFFFAPDDAVALVVFLLELALVALVERVEDDTSESSTCFR